MKKITKSGSKKLRIAVFHLAFLYSGGGERLVLEESIRLKKLGNSVDCFAPVIDKQNCFPELQKQVHIHRLLPRILPKWYPDNALLSILAACVFTPLFFYKYRKYDIYLGANQPGPWLAFVLSKLNNKPYIIYLAQPTRLIHPRLIDQQVGLRINFGFSMLNTVTKIFKPLISLFDAISIKHAHSVLANGTYAKGLLEEVYGIKAVNCPAGSKSRLKISDENIKNRYYGKLYIGKNVIPKPYILLTNRHFPHKKFEYALEAFKKMKRKKVNMIITGQETEYTYKLKSIYDQDKRIHFVGLLSERDLNLAYKNALLYVYPAPEEDFGMGIIEAMSYGLPVVAWGNAGPTGIIKHGVDGFLVRPFDTVQFAFFMDKLIKSRVIYRKIAKASQDTVYKYFTYKNHTKIIDKIIKEQYLFWKKRNIRKSTGTNLSFNKNNILHRLQTVKSNFSRS